MAFTTKSFANEALYEWMASVIEGVYRFSCSRPRTKRGSRGTQLAFERQETPQGFIKRGCWSPALAGSTPAIASIPGSTDAVRGAVSGAARRCATSISRPGRLTQSAETAADRDRLARATDPLAFEQFRLTGRMAFETPMELFDRKFPGHYRLIRRVRPP